MFTFWLSTDLLNHFAQGGCIIRAGFLDDIKNAYKRNPDLENLVLDDWFANKLVERQQAWRDVVKIAITNGEFPCHLKTACKLACHSSLLLAVHYSDVCEHATTACCLLCTRATDV